MEGGEKVGWLKMEGESARQRLTPSHIEKKHCSGRKESLLNETKKRKTERKDRQNREVGMS